MAGKPLRGRCGSCSRGQAIHREQSGRHGGGRAPRKPTPPSTASMMSLTTRCKITATKSDQRDGGASECRSLGVPTLSPLTLRTRPASHPWNTQGREQHPAAGAPAQQGGSQFPTPGTGCCSMNTPEGRIPNPAHQPPSPTTPVSQGKAWGQGRSEGGGHQLGPGDAGTASLGRSWVLHRDL